MDLIFVRLLFLVVVALTCFVIEPFGLTRNVDAGVGALVGAAIVLFEWKLRTVSLKRLIGAAIGSFLGICGAYLFALVIRNSIPEGHTQSFLQILVSSIKGMFPGFLIWAVLPMIPFIIAEQRWPVGTAPRSGRGDGSAPGRSQRKQY